MKTKFKLRKYQTKAITDATNILKKRSIVYIAGEIRTGKTLISLFIADEVLKDSPIRPNVLFLTKKKAIKSIQEDYKVYPFNFNILVASMDSIHKVSGRVHIVIVDEAHSFGAFPKPSLRTKNLRKLIYNNDYPPTILLSGTPSPESYSQFFHQFWMTYRGPWPYTLYGNFYHWASYFVDVKKKYIGNARPVNDYSQVNDQKQILAAIKPYMVSLSQEQAGFNGEVKEIIIHLPTPPNILKAIEVMKKEKIAFGNFLIANTPAHLMIIYHQLASGTFKDSKGEFNLLSDYKAKYIRKHFAGKKIAIFYNYIAEGMLLREMFPFNTDSPEEFNSTNETMKFICQVTSGSMGVNLSSADYIIFFNISHSATQYWQARGRSQTIDGGDKQVVWLFSDTGIEDDIYNVVKEKKKYTVSHFTKFAKFKKGSKQLKLF